MVDQKQVLLRPQDLVVAVKLAVNREKHYVLATLAAELEMPVSGVHGSVRRAEFARLISRSAGSIRAVRASVKEFALYGAKYAFPAALGASARGTPTAVGAPALAQFFDQGKLLPPVWPDPVGEVWGPSVTPLHSSVPAAARADARLYDFLALLDAIRVGAARERELAQEAIDGQLS